jgi:RNA polymerase sporulation-specific sigma factor
MAKSKKRLVVKKEEVIVELDYFGLIKIVKSRKKSNKFRANEAYNEIEKRVKPKLMYIVNQFYIPGCNRDDVYQEALYALRFKAIPDYRKNRGRNGNYPFDNFAVLCIRRHLSTLLKSSFQNKRKALNTSISLDQDRNSTSDDVLLLSDILPRTDDTVLDLLENKEYHKKLFGGLHKKLSIFEKKVFSLYIQKYSYEEMSKIINDNYKKKNIRKRINVKSIDNALSRLKQKAKEVFDKYG